MYMFLMSTSHLTYDYGHVRLVGVTIPSFCSCCIIANHRIYNKNNMINGARIAYHFGTIEFVPDVSGVRVIHFVQFHACLHISMFNVAISVMSSSLSDVLFGFTPKFCS